MNPQKRKLSTFDWSNLNRFDFSLIVFPRSLSTFWTWISRSEGLRLIGLETFNSHHEKKTNVGDELKKLLKRRMWCFLITYENGSIIGYILKYSLTASTTRFFKLLSFMNLTFVFPKTFYCVSTCFRYKKGHVQPRTGTSPINYSANKRGNSCSCWEISW